MTMPKEGWCKRSKDAKKERLRDVIRKDPHCTTKILFKRFSLCKDTIRKIRKEILEELGIDPLNSQYITETESRKAMREVVHPWRPKKKTAKKVDK